MQEIPFSAAVGNVVQHVHRLAEVAAVDVVGCRLQPHFLLGISIIIPCGAAVSVRAAEWVEAAERAIAAVSISAIRRTSALVRGAVLAFIHDLFVRLLHLFEFFFCFCFIRIIDIGIRVILSAQLPVCLFYFIIRCVSGNSQHAVWI